MLKTLVKGCEPTRGSKYSAAVDLYASEDCIIAAGETKIIGLGVAIDLDYIKYKDAELDEDGRYNLVGSELNVSEEKLNDWLNVFMIRHYLELHPRSSLRAKGLISNTGIIDLDYEDEIKIIIRNPIRTESIVNTLRVYQYKEELDAFNFDYKIKKGDKIAQITLIEHKVHLFGINTDEDRTGGFGSTGK